VVACQGGAKAATRQDILRRLDGFLAACGRIERQQRTGGATL